MSVLLGNFHCKAQSRHETMRSKSKARKLTPDESDGTLSSSSPSSPHLEDDTGMTTDFTPVRIPQNIPIPDDIELRESRAVSAVGVWSRRHIPTGQKFGPFLGVLKTDIDDTSCAWELVDEVGKVKGWIDASELGTGNWMKYVRSAEDRDQQNLMAVQVEDKVYYKAIRDIAPGKEMLLYARDAVYPENELEAIARQKMEDEEKNYVCPQCNELFRSKVALRRHQTYACNNRGSILKAINQDFHDEGSFSMDREIPSEIESGDSGEFKCDQCPKSFQWKSNLIRHQVIHSDGSHYLCENCDKYFTDPSNLQRHIRSQHIGARAHTCQDCGKTFATSSGLKQHQHIHSSVKPFQCEVCLKAYTQFSNLCRHKRMHADCRQQIKCKDCGQAFSTVTSLSKHKRFCEGALRNGMRMCYSGADKLSPISIPTVNQTSPLQPSYMGLYGARPPFPFYPSLGASFPIFPPGHPMTGMATHMSPNMKFGQMLSPDSKPLMNAFGNALFPHVKDEGTENRKMENRSTERSDGSDLTDVSTGSDLDVSSVSDVESEGSIDRKMPRCSTPTLKHPAPPSPKSADSSDEVLRDFPRMRKSLSPSHRPQATRSPPTALAVPLTSTPPQEQTMPFDLSKGTSPAVRPTPTSGDQPLDLSQKAAIILPPETPRKTHIFGEMKSPAMDAKQLHYAYPLPSPVVMDTLYRMDKEKIQSFHDAAKLMAYTRYPLTSPTYAAMGSLGMMQHDIEKSMSPIVKMEKSPNQYRYSPGNNKMKERYACKFCGKIFPRSANLTRHLRTHTGEQPYKCKYCERSFSISSNLQRHVRNIHNKEKPFKCDQCDRCFGQQTNLDRHLKKHDTEGPNVTDSPTNELEDKEESYFSEIRNFIDREGNQMLLNRNVEKDGIKAELNSEAAMSPEEDVDMSDDTDSEDNDSLLSEPLLKKQRLAEPLLMNNNETEPRKPLPYLNGYLPSTEKVSLLNTGYTPLACST